MSRSNKKKECVYKDKMHLIDYKNYKLLKQHTTERGKIVPRRITNVSAKTQRLISLNIKRARQLGLLPFLARD